MHYSYNLIIIEFPAFTWETQTNKYKRTPRFPLIAENKRQLTMYQMFTSHSISFSKANIPTVQNNIDRE